MRDLLKFTACLVSAIALLRCSNAPSQSEKIALYNDALDQIINDNYFQHCVILTPEVEQIQNNYFSGMISEAEYQRKIDSLKSNRRGHKMKCVLDYDESETSDLLNDSLIETIAEDSLFQNFDGVSREAITDTLSRPGQLVAKDLRNKYLDIIPHANQRLRPYGEGMGVVTLSRISFNSKSDRAILFYKFLCGPKCGSGEAVFLVKNNGKWIVQKYIRIWNS